MNDLLDEGMPQDAIPQALDDAQTVLTRRLLRSHWKLAVTLDGLDGRVDLIEAQTATCASTHDLLQGIITQAFPYNDPEKNITVRVKALEARMPGRARMDETNRMVREVHEQLFPKDGSKHITTRVQSLETASHGWRSKGWAILQALLVAALIAIAGATLSAMSNVQRLESQMKLMAPTKTTP